MSELTPPPGTPDERDDLVKRDTTDAPDDVQYLVTENERLRQQLEAYQSGVPPATPPRIEQRPPSGQPWQEPVNPATTAIAEEPEQLEVGSVGWDGERPFLVLGYDDDTGEAIIGVFAAVQRTAGSLAADRPRPSDEP